MDRPTSVFQNLQGSIIFDATTLDGRYSSAVTNRLELTEFGHRWYTGSGLELHSNVNIGFHIPIQLTLGLYYGEDQESFGGIYHFFQRHPVTS